MKPKTPAELELKRRIQSRIRQLRGMYPTMPKNVIAREICVELDPYGNDETLLQKIKKLIK